MQIDIKKLTKLIIDEIDLFTQDESICMEQIAIGNINGLQISISFNRLDDPDFDAIELNTGDECIKQ